MPASVDDLRSYRFDVGYDSELATATECTSANGVCSIDVVAPDTVRTNGSDLAGITGDDVLLGTVTFLAGSNTGVADPIVDESILVLSDTDGGAPGALGNFAPSDGAMTIATATAAPAAALIATTAPAAVPQTGGAPGASSTSPMAWLLTAGLAVVFAGSGAWVLARAGREN